MNHDPWTHRYLALLGEPPRPPSRAALGRLVRAQLTTIPFENSLALRRRMAAGDAGPVAPIDTDAVLLDWLARRAGGVCFEHTALFGRLLQALGYALTPIAGEISFPGSHQALVLSLERRQWLVDVGNGAPFFEPIPLDQTLELGHAGLVFRFGPDANDPGIWLQEREIDGAWKTWCRYRLQAQSAADRETAYQRHHRPRETWVTNSIVLMACGDDEVLVVRNGEQHRHRAQGGPSTTRLADAGDWAALPAAVGLPAWPALEVAQTWAAINGQPLPPGL